MEIDRLNALRKKFPAKDKGPDASKAREHRAKVKAIAREFERKKAELTGGAPSFKRGIGYYLIVILALLMVGALVLSGLGKGGRPRIERSQIMVDRSMDNLAIALGRYRFHVGEFPSPKEGLEALAAITPSKPGWFGPYIKKVVKDPWGHDYVYDLRRDGSPVLYSKGPDGRAGTTDDILPKQELFEEAFRDTTWTNHWMPYQLRGIIVAPDEETRRRIQEEVKKY